MGVICKNLGDKNRTKNENKNKNNTKTKGGTGDIISPEEFDQITNSLISQNNDLIKQKENLEKENDLLKRKNEELNTQLINIQNINCNNNIIGGNINNENNQNKNIINKNQIKFVLIDGNEICITKSYLKKTSEILNALRAQKPNLPDIDHLVFMVNGLSITNYFKDYLDISSLNFDYPIILQIQ